MLLGIGSYTCPWAVQATRDTPACAFELLDTAARWGVKVVQYCDNLPLERLSEAEQKRLAEAAAARGIRIELGMRGCRTDSVVEQLGLAHRLGSRLLRLVTDSEDDRPAPDEIVARLRSLLPLCERLIVCLAVENHDRLPAQALADIMRRLASPYAGICLDTVNSLGCLEGPGVVVETLGPWTVNLHVKDAIARRLPHQLGFVIEGAPAGRGLVNVPAVLARLGEMGRDVSVILEQWTPPEPGTAETLAKERLWAEQGIAYLRTMVKD